jgi:hypothetical protein
MIKYFHIRENGEIMTWGDEPLPGALAIDAPSDFIEKGMHRFILAGGVLIEREPDPIISEPLSAEKLAYLARLRE